VKLVSFLASLFIRTLHATLRVQHVHAENIENTPQYILSFWHAHLLLMLHSRFRRPISVISSRSKDGEYAARVFDWYGVDCVRGSSTRGGGAALREQIRRTRAGMNIAFTPDGPTGPARVAKDGVVLAAQLSGLPIIPIAFAARTRKLLGSWDRMVVPYPFSKALFLYGEPILVPRDADIHEWRQRIEDKMNELADEAERRVQEAMRKER
jgi:lysophospholipid acyltransferase (LPLAT)-like uncharacterized protein